jgi:hypothetical protein
MNNNLTFHCLLLSMSGVGSMKGNQHIETNAIRDQNSSDNSHQYTTQGMIYVIKLFKENSNMLRALFRQKYPLHFSKGFRNDENKENLLIQQFNDDFLVSINHSSQERNIVGVFVGKRTQWDKATLSNKKDIILMKCIELIQLGYLEASDFGYSKVALETSDAKDLAKRTKRECPVMDTYETINKHLFSLSPPSNPSPLLSPLSSSSLSSATTSPALETVSQQQLWRNLLKPVSETFSFEKLSMAPVSHIIIVNVLLTLEIKDIEYNDILNEKVYGHSLNNKVSDQIKICGLTSPLSRGKVVGVDNSELVLLMLNLDSRINSNYQTRKGGKCCADFCHWGIPNACLSDGWVHS